MSNKKEYNTGDAWLDQHWNNPLAPLNSAYNPKAKGWSAQATASMEAGGFYDNHTREECAIEWRKRYDELKAGG